MQIVRIWGLTAIISFILFISTCEAVMANLLHP